MINRHTMRCLIVDDEPVARQGLEEYIRDVDFLELAGQCENSMKAAALLKQETVDLVYLDIHMPRLSGIELLRILKNPPMVIFITAYQQYALEGYSLDVVDYLMKPVTFDRFLKASQKAYDLMTLKLNAQSHEIEDEHFFIKVDGKIEKIFFREVLFIEALQNYVTIHTTAKKFITYLTMASLELQLPKDKFIKVHKSFIVSISQVKTIEGNEVIIAEHRIPVSRLLKDTVVQHILGNKLFRR